MVIGLVVSSSGARISMASGVKLVPVQIKKTCHSYQFPPKLDVATTWKGGMQASMHMERGHAGLYAHDMFP